MTELPHATIAFALAAWVVVVGVTRIAADCYRLQRIDRCLVSGNGPEAKRIMDRLKAEAAARNRR